MRDVVRSAPFRRDVKLCEKRGKDMDKLRTLVLQLAEGKKLPPQYRDHALTGEWKCYRDSHIESDWLLVYRIDGSSVYLARTGTHADLF